MGASCSLFGPSPQERLFEAARTGDSYMVDELLRNSPCKKGGGGSGGSGGSGGGGGGGRGGGGGKGASVSASDEHGFTALHLAAEHGHAKVVAELLARGAGLNARTLSGFTPLALAARCGDDESVLALLNEGAEVQHVDLAYGATASMWAVEKCRSTTVEAICAHSSSAVFQQRNRSGCTMLILAVEKGRLDTIRFMIRAGARASAKDSKGRSAASVARDRRLTGPAIDILFEAEEREAEEEAAGAKKLEAAAESRASLRAASERRSGSGGGGGGGGSSSGSGGGGASGDSSAAGTPLGRVRSTSLLQQPHTPNSLQARMPSSSRRSLTGSSNAGGGSPKRM
jgi:uncharacterized membrane protein YgcG